MDTNKKKQSTDADLINSLQEILNDSHSLTNNEVYMNFWSKHEAALGEKLSQLQSESRMNALKEEVKSFIT